MKLDLVYDHEPARRAASVAIDKWYARQIVERYPLAALHAVKARTAAVAPIIENDFSHALADEAKTRGMSLSDLRALVTKRAIEQENDLLLLELQRQDVKRELAAATSFQVIEGIQRRFA